VNWLGSFYKCIARYSEESLIPPSSSLVVRRKPARNKRVCRYMKSLPTDGPSLSFGSGAGGTRWTCTVPLCTWCANITRYVNMDRDSMNEGSSACILGSYITNLNSLTYQNNTAAFKEEWISPTLGRTLRSSIQDNSTVLHNSSLNPSCFAPSGFVGRTPSTIALTARISDWNSR